MAQQKSRTQQLNGLPALAYVGVQPSSPQNFIIKQSAPTTNDYRNVYVGDLWLDNSSMYPPTNTAPTVANLWILVSVKSHVATWRNFQPAGISAETFPTDSGIAVPAAGVLKIIADVATRHCGASVLFTGVGNTVKLNVTDVLGNTFIGLNSGGTAVTGDNNGALGQSSLINITSGVWNSCGGSSNMPSLTVGNRNIAFGVLALQSLVSGERNLGFGFQQTAYTSNESDNILFMTDGVTGENGAIRLGNLGTHTSCYVQGIASVVVSNTEMVTIDTTTGQLGSQAISSGSVIGLRTDDTNVVTPTAGIINLAGAHGLNTTGTIGPDTATVAINNSIVLGDLAVLGTGIDALTAVTGDISSTIGNFNLGPSNNAGTRGYVTIENFGGGGGQVPILGFQGNNLMAGGNAFAPTLVGGTAVANILIGGGYSSITTGQDNTVCSAGGATNLTTGSSNSIFGGSFAGYTLANGSFNTLIGTLSGTTIATGLISGSRNTLVGYNCGAHFTNAESDNIYLGIVTGNAGENATFRVQNGATPISRSFIEGISGVNVVGVSVQVDGAGQLGVVVSSARYKENIEDMGCDSNVLFKLRPVSFKYKKHPAGSKSVGLIAEEVAVSAPELVVYDKDGIPETVRYNDLVPMLLNEVIKLNKRIEKLERE